ncbi:hypothetical protein [Synechococcus sp. PROS-U-1]|uniref:hypothetical protein n=1 Tax=Synechococcus sp. PROS-U-1 TaxID=1400866 RepID=UPI001647238A|nr:hypothetical protein [Synechococcus sp. PROS-U-1]
MFLAEPDRYGRFGHQSFSLLSAWALAHRYNCEFLPTKYSYFAYRHNDHVDFSRSIKAFGQSSNDIERYEELKGKNHDENGNTKYNLSDISDISKFETEIEKISRKQGKSLVKLPFDQTPGSLIWRMNNAMKDDIRNIFGVHEKTRYKQKKVCLHIRRGDVQEVNHPNWYIDDRYYKNLVRDLYKECSDQIEITILTQGDNIWESRDEFKGMRRNGFLKVSSTSSQWTNDFEVRDFRTMLDCDLLIAGQSSFSMLADIVRNGEIELSLIKNVHSRPPHDIYTRNIIKAEVDLNNDGQSEKTIKYIKDNILKI